MASSSFGPGIQAFTIYDTTDGSVFQISGKDISPESSVRKTKITRDSAQGGAQKVVVESVLELRFADDSIFASLEAEDSQTMKWNAVAAGINGGNLQWYEDETFVVDEVSIFDPTSTEYPYVLRMRNISTNPAIYLNQNLLAYKGWADADSNNIADGYGISGGVTAVSFSSGVQTIEIDGQFQDMFGFVVFPVSGVTLSLSVNITDTHSTETIASRVEAQDYSSSNVGSNQVTISSTGVIECDLELPANSYTIDCSLVRQTSSGSVADNVSLQFPALTTNGKLTSGTSFMNH